MGGVGSPVTIPPENFSKRENSSFTQASTVAHTVGGKTVNLSPPELKDGTSDSSNHGVIINCFPQFAFDKISPPEYGVKNNAVARYTGVPYYADFIKDYYFISLFRLTDKMTMPAYSGIIKELFSTPRSSS